MTPSTIRALLVRTPAAVLLAACARSTNPQTDAVPAAPRREGAAITAEEIQQSPGDPIEKLLMNKSPGVWVGRAPDGGLAVRIRGGTSSVYGNNEPLYILDGSPIEAGPGGSLSGVNPYDIESIKVLKEAADITMYGVRGANGVIVIKTKRGNSRPPGAA
jgi:TonB-dependent SusC/RagA subfamily outer membrane receptor